MTRGDFLPRRILASQDAAPMLRHNRSAGTPCHPPHAGSAAPAIPFYLHKNQGWRSALRMQQDITSGGGSLSQINTPTPACSIASSDGPVSGSSIAIVTEVNTGKDGLSIPAKIIGSTQDNRDKHHATIQEVPAAHFLDHPGSVHGRLDTTQP